VLETWTGATGVDELLALHGTQAVLETWTGATGVELFCDVVVFGAIHGFQTVELDGGGVTGEMIVELVLVGATHGFQALGDVCTGETSSVVV
jgi:hypothetical protein